MQKNKIISMVGSVTGVLLLSKLLGFVKQMVMASFFGTTLQTDIINLSQGLISNIQYVLVQSLMTALIAVYIHASNENPEESDRLVSDTVKFFLGFAGAVAAAVAIFAPQLADILAPTYDATAKLELIRYLRFFAPVLILLALICIFQAVLQANKRFLPGEFVGLNQSVILIILMVLFADSWGPNVLAVGFYCYAVWNTLYLGYASRKLWHFRPGNALKNPSMRKLLRMMLPLLLGYSIVYVNEMVDKMLVSGLEEGAVTALSYASVLSNLVSTFIVTFASMLFPYITAHISAHRNRHAAEQAEQITVLLLLVFCPVSVLTILCAQDIVTVAFGRGAFDTQSVVMVATALKGYGAMILPLILREVYARLQYGYQDTKSPMINSSVGIIANIILSIILSQYLGILGITVASSISVLICGVMNVFSAQKHNRDVKPQEILRVLPWLLLGGAGCAATAYILSGYLEMTGALIRIAAVALCSMLAYAVIVSPKLLHMTRQLKSWKESDK